MLLFSLWFIWFFTFLIQFLLFMLFDFLHLDWYKTLLFLVRYFSLIRCLHFICTGLIATFGDVDAAVDRLLQQSQRWRGTLLWSTQTHTQTSIFEMLTLVSPFPLSNLIPADDSFTDVNLLNAGIPYPEDPLEQDAICVWTPWTPIWIHIYFSSCRRISLLMRSNFTLIHF